MNTQTIPHGEKSNDDDYGDISNNDELEFANDNDDDDDDGMDVDDDNFDEDDDISVVSSCNHHPGNGTTTPPRTQTTRTNSMPGAITLMGDVVNVNSLGFGISTNNTSTTANILEDTDTSASNVTTAVLSPNFNRMMDSLVTMNYSQQQQQQHQQLPNTSTHRNHHHHSSWASSSYNNSSGNVFVSTSEFDTNRSSSPTVAGTTQAGTSFPPAPIQELSQQSQHHQHQQPQQVLPTNHEDMGYEPCVPQARTSCMTEDEEKHRRASIQAVLRDVTLSPLTKRRSIQHLMDGRRNSMGTTSSTISAATTRSSLTQSQHPYPYHTTAAGMGRRYSTSGTSSTGGGTGVNSGPFSGTTTIGRRFSMNSGIPGSRQMLLRNHSSGSTGGSSIHSVVSATSTYCSTNDTNTTNYIELQHNGARPHHQLQYGEDSFANGSEHNRCNSLDYGNQSLHNNTNHSSTHGYGGETNNNPLSFYEIDEFGSTTTNSAYQYEQYNNATNSGLSARTSRRNSIAELMPTNEDEVVLYDNDVWFEQQQQPSSSISSIGHICTQIPSTSPSDTPGASASTSTYYAISNIQTKYAEMNRPPCSHYERNCSIIAPCCGAAFGCRICHDDCPTLPPKINSGRQRYHRSASLPSSFISMDQEDTHHNIDRFAIREVTCRVCYTRQSSKTNNCVKCHTQFGEYHCTICNLWMSNKEQPYHCADCGFCRVGGKENFEHCNSCGMCIDKALINTHNCKAGKYRSNCPVCQEYLFSSRSASHEMPCGHAIHWDCFRQLAAHDSRCPICKKTAESRERMLPTWDAMAAGIALQPIPPEFARVVSMTCNDCEKPEDARAWHFLGMQCSHCSSFNTVVDKIHLSGEEAHEFLETNARIAAAHQQRSNENPNNNNDNNNNNGEGEANNNNRQNMRRRPNRRRSLM